MSDLTPDQIHEILQDPTGELFQALEGKSARNQVIAALREKFAVHMRLYLADPDNPRGRANLKSARMSVLEKMDALQGEDRIIYPWMKSAKTHPAQVGVQAHSILDRAVGPFLEGHSQFKD